MKGLITLLLGEGWKTWWLAGHPKMLAAYWTLKFQYLGLKRPCLFILALPSLSWIVPKISLTTRRAPI